MRIKVKLIAIESPRLGTGFEGGEGVVEVDDGAGPDVVLSRLGLAEPESYMIIVNGDSVPPSRRRALRLEDGDQVSVFPPIRGG